MADKRLNIKIRTDGAKKAKGALGGVDNKMKSLAKSAMAAGAAFFAAQGLIRGFKAVIRLAGEQEQAEKRLEVALGKTSTALLNQATALQQMTTFGDEAIIGVQASIAAFVDSEEQIKLATEATLDMAVAMGMDLKGAGDLIAKTLGSSTNALSRYGITVEGAVGSTERLESLTQNVAKLFGGQAKAQAETMAGAIDQSKNAMGDLGETIGRKLSPIIKAAAADTTLLANNLITLLDGVPEEAPKGIEEIVKELEALRTIVGFDDEGNLLEAFISAPKATAWELWAESVENSVDPVMVKLIELQEEYKRLFNIRFNKEQSEESFAMMEDELDILGNIALTEEENDFAKTQRLEKEKGLREKIRIGKEQLLVQELKQAALVQGSAKDAMKAVVRAETMEAIAGHISSIFQSVPLPYSLVLAAGAGAVVSGIIDKGLSSFAQGGDFVTSGPQMIAVGDNPGGRERVQVTPLSSPNIDGPQGSITVNISAPLVDETVIDSIIPAIEKAQRLNLA